MGRCHRREDSRPRFIADALEVSNNMMIDSCHFEDAEESRRRWKGVEERREMRGSCEPCFMEEERTHVIHVAHGKVGR